jgi:hypothetical protein
VIYLARTVLALAAVLGLSACVTYQQVKLVSACEYGFERFAEVPDGEPLAKWQRYEFLEQNGCVSSMPSITP